MSAFMKFIKRLRRKYRQKAYWSGSGQFGSSPLDAQMSMTPVVWDNEDPMSPFPSDYTPKKGEDTRKIVKPVDVVTTILAETPVLDLSNLDAQIRIIKKRIKVLSEQTEAGLFDEKRALGYLQARKQYNRIRAKLTWPITTDALIKKLCKECKLMHVPFSAYYKTIPSEAVDELERFCAAVEAVRPGRPELTLIVDEGGPEHKKDPILLAASPFGNWYYVLGAWDKEVEVVDDLIYKGK